MEIEEKRQFINWVNQLARDYAAFEDRELFLIDQRQDHTLLSPDNNDYNHLIAVVFDNAPINGELTEFFFDADGLHFHKYHFPLATADYGIQVHLVYKSEHEKLNWVESRCFHKGNTYAYRRYIRGSERSFYSDPSGWETIHHG